MKATDTPDKAEIEYYMKYFGLDEKIVREAFKMCHNDLYRIRTFLSKEKTSRSSLPDKKEIDFYMKKFELDERIIRLAFKICKNDPDRIRDFLKGEQTSKWSLPDKAKIDLYMKRTGLDEKIIRLVFKICKNRPSTIYKFLRGRNRRGMKVEKWHDEIDLVMIASGVSKERAAKAFENFNGDVVEAIFYLTSR